MNRTSLLGHAAELVRIIRKSPQPADALASEYTRARKYIGATDRRFITGLVFHTLRILSLAEHLAAVRGYADCTEGALLHLEDPSVIHDGACTDAPPHVLLCTQQWLLDGTRGVWGQEADALWTLFQSPAPVGLRVNLRRCTRESVLDRLRQDGIVVEAGVWSPAAIIMKERVRLENHPLVRDGFLEIQDEGSQMIAIAAGPTAGTTILDSCAGAGGKTLHMADIVQDKATILARDIEPGRLRELPGRARRAGLQCIRTSLVRRGEHWPQGLARPGADLVLVDAPCSGLGTARRLPMVKWRLTPELANRHHRKQVTILSDNAHWVADGGVLVYATCSILPDENHAVVDHFLEHHPDFVAERLPEPCSSAHAASVTSSYASCLQMDTVRHSTDGLFVARFRKGAHS
jgi:16S rRNA (cytosine967-C5)-methyltransferase